jgi:hypothetical protein
MKRYLSKQAVWHDKTDAILTLSGRPVHLKYPDGTERETKILIHLCPTSDRKVGVTMWTLAEPSDQPFHSAAEPRAEEFEDMPQTTLFFNAAAVELLLARVATDPSAELSLNL